MRLSPATAGRGDHTGAGGPAQGEPAGGGRARRAPLVPLDDSGRLQALRRAEERLQALLQNSADFVLVWDGDGAITYFTPSVRRFIGDALDSREPGKELGITHPDDRGHVLEAIARVRARRGRVERFRFRGKRTDGEYRWLDATLSNLLDHATVGGIVLNARDVTGEVEAERALQETNDALRRSNNTMSAIVENSPLAIYALDRESNVMLWNPACEQLLGIPAADIVGSRLWIVPEEQQPQFEWLQRQVARGRVLNGIEARTRRPDGREIDVAFSAAPLIDEGGEHTGMLIVCADVTDKKQTEQALRRSEATFRGVVQHASDLILLLDSDGLIRYASPAVEELLGYTEESVLGLDPVDFVHPDDLEAATGWFEADVTNGGPRSEIRVKHADGSWRVVEAIGSNLLDDPLIQTFVVTARDITSRREAEEALRRSEARYRAIVEDQTEFITRADSQGRYTFVNDAFARAIDRTPVELLGLSVLELFDAGEIQEVLDVIDDRGRGTVTTEHRTVLPDGEVRWAHWTTRPVLDDDGEVVEYQSVGRDVTDRKRAEERLAAQAEILELVAKGRPLSETLDALCAAVEQHVPGARTAVQLLDEAGRGLVCAAAPAMPESFSRAAATLAVGPQAGASGAAVATGSEVIIADVASDPGFRAHRDGCLANDIAAIWAIPIRSASGGAVLGAFTVYHRFARGPRDDERQLLGQIVHLAAIAVDRKAFESRLAHQAHHDPLTGLPNRSLFFEFLTHALARSSRSGSAVAVLFLDLDRFKYVNDSFGHDAGDELLGTLAERLQRVVRPGDTIARFGGDEFVVLCEDLPADTASERAIEVAERLIDVVQSPFSCQGQAHFLSTSIGIACSMGVDARPEALLRDADAAMYRAKERGKGRWEVFDEAMRMSVVQRVETENALHRAIERNEFDVFYQPVLSLRDGQCVGAEALVRWRHPERGLVSPTEFITLAEETGLVVPLGQLVLEQACRQAEVWRRSRGDDRFTISVNLSARQLARTELVSDVAGALSSTGLPPSMLCLEITESVLMDDVEMSLAAIRSLKALGIRLSIDDFGTGYSSLGYLKRLPVDAVKVDRSFVDGLGTDPEDSAIVAAVVNLGHTLGLTVVAEGVETGVQLDELVALGCDQAQGFLFSAAKPATELGDLTGPFTHL